MLKPRIYSALAVIGMCLVAAATGADAAPTGSATGKTGAGSEAKTVQSGKKIAAKSSATNGSPVRGAANGGAASGASSKLGGESAKTSAETTSSGAPALHRADFRVEGASCVVCLRRIAKTMRDTKGVMKADVSIYRPYWAIAIYDAKTAKFDDLLKKLSADEKVRFMEMEDKPIAAMPLVVIPKVSQSQSTAPQTK